MNAANESHRMPEPGGLALVLARWILGAFFVYVGLSKALHPGEFLQLVRQYDVVDSPILLNLIASLLPWLEVFCGLLLVAGVAVRGAALLLFGMLICFTALVLRRALALHAADGIPFCAIRFDCGCGTGKVFICGKLTENILLLVLSGMLLRWAGGKWCARFSLGREKT